MKRGSGRPTGEPGGPEVGDTLPGRRTLRAFAVVTAVCAGCLAAARLWSWEAGQARPPGGHVWTLLLAAIATAGSVLGRRPLWEPFGRIEGAFVGAFGVGLLAFALGFFGPMVLMPSDNLSPLWGFVTGPVGFVLGGILGAVLAEDQVTHLSV